MTRRGRAGWLAAAVLVAGCDGPPAPDPAAQRLEALAAGFTAATLDPAAAARWFEAAGPGAALERARLEAWLDALEAAGAPTEDWRRVLAAPPPEALQSRALVGLGRALLAEGRGDEGRRALERAAAAGSVDAWRVLLGLPATRVAAAARLAVTDPVLLHRLAPELEELARARLEPAERSVLAEALIAQERFAAAARELSLIAPASVRHRSVSALARAAAGERTAALAELEGLADPTAHLARASILRDHAWTVYPDPGAAAWWERALAAARAAAASPETRSAGLPLVLESATEAGALDEAWAAWQALEADGWGETPRGWLGRRLGVALAQRGGADEAVEALAGALPVHERCLAFWRAERTGDRRTMQRLAEAPVADVYAQWARRRLGEAPPRRLEVQPPVGLTPPPPTVRQLLEWGATGAASAEWRRLRERRGALAGEALAAAALEAGLGRTTEAIRWLLAGHPALGTVHADEVPQDVLQAYLPLLFVGDLRRAADEAGVAPWLVAAVARQESTFQPGARSAAGALGVLQLVPGTAAPHAAALGLGPEPDLLDPSVNLRVGARELARLLERFGDRAPALAAYNAGEARAAGWWERTPDSERFTEEIAIPETYNYVRRVEYLAEAYRLLYDDLWRSSP